MKMEIDLTTKNLTSAELNKQIVRMRKVIKKAKEELIRDLVRKSRKMKATLNKDAVAPKRNRKAVRMLLEINELKNLKYDDIAKFVLINEISFNQIAKQGTMKERALARLSDQKHIKKEIESFRNNFPKWAFQVQSLLNTWEFNTKMMKKKKKKKSINDPPLKQQENVKVKIETIENDTKEKDQEEMEENDDKKVQKNKVEKDDVNLLNGETERGKIKAKKSKSDSIDTLQKKLKVMASGNDHSEKLSLQKISEKLKQSEEKVDKTMGEVVVKRFNLDVESEELKIHKSKSISTSNLPSSMPQSSFFLDMDNNELGIGESDEEVDDSHAHKNYEKVSNTSNSKRKSLKPAAFKSNSRTTGKNPKIPNNKNNFNHKEMPSTTTVLHPSWAAKRNQRQSIFTEVKAKKIKFED